ncbi:MAG: hypothetical protein PHY28_07745 [Dehalococcoidales bacterium]|nr:hypothetical protein [Dehalococcoidales bacterium]
MGVDTKRWIAKVMLHLLWNENGAGLLEMLVAVAIVGVALTTFITALSTGSLSVGTLNEATVAQGLAQSQMEKIKAATYAAGYTSDLTLPAGYGVAINVSSIPGANINIQKITVTINRDSQPVLVMEDYKVNR